MAAKLAGPPISVDKINDSDNTHNTVDSRLCDEEKDSVARVPRGGKTAQYYREYRARKKAEREKEKLEMIAGSQTKKRKTGTEYQRARKKDSTFAVPSISAGASITTDESTVVNSPITAGTSTRVDGLQKRDDYAAYSLPQRRDRTTFLVKVPSFRLCFILHFMCIINL
ncbi:uncharacterized protein LOC126765367 [Bactrocera neohumeralis]|uniref:uncharacterized protein LOC126765367 n=1 Tax=Bactrocera neohumeralis TaxID=98809 RepID=UPI0021666E04|nr:uncharacterized protein LOC126765367 [Bactrocera neohumeralis]